VSVISRVHMDKESLEESLKLVGYDNEELFAYLQQKALGNPLIEVKINKEFDERAVKEKTVVYKPDKDDPMDTASAMDQVSEEVPALDTFYWNKSMLICGIHLCAIWCYSWWRSSIRRGTSPLI